MEFANHFHQPYSRIYFAEGKSVRYFPDPDKPAEISRQDVFTFEEYENRFNEILNQGHSWINLSFEGMLDDTLLIIIERPRYKNNIPPERVSVNLSLPEWKTIDNNWDAAPFFKITN